MPPQVDKLTELLEVLAEHPLDILGEGAELLKGLGDVVFAKISKVVDRVFAFLASLPPKLQGVIDWIVGKLGLITGKFPIEEALSKIASALDGKAFCSLMGQVKRFVKLARAVVEGFLPEGSQLRETVTKILESVELIASPSELISKYVEPAISMLYRVSNGEVAVVATNQTLSPLLDLAKPLVLDKLRDLQELGELEVDRLVESAANFTDGIIAQLADKAGNLGAELFDQLMPDWLPETLGKVAKLIRDAYETLGFVHQLLNNTEPIATFLDKPRELAELACASPGCSGDTGVPPPVAPDLSRVAPATEDLFGGAGAPGRLPQLGAVMARVGQSEEAAAACAADPACAAEVIDALGTAAESLVRFKAAQEDVRAIVPFARYGAMCGHEAAFRAGRLSMPLEILAQLWRALTYPGGLLTKLQHAICSEKRVRVQYEWLHPETADVRVDGRFTLPEWLQVSTRQHTMPFPTPLARGLPDAPPPSGCRTDSARRRPTSSSSARRRAPERAPPRAVHRRAQCARRTAPTRPPPAPRVPQANAWIDNTAERLWIKLLKVCNWAADQLERLQQWAQATMGRLNDGLAGAKELAGDVLERYILPVHQGVSKALHLITNAEVIHAKVDRVAGLAKTVVGVIRGVTGATDALDSALPPPFKLEKLAKMSSALNMAAAKGNSSICNEPKEAGELWAILKDHWHDIKGFFAGVSDGLNAGEAAMIPVQLLQAFSSAICFVRMSAATVHHYVDGAVAMLDRFIRTLTIGVWRDPPEPECKDAYFCIEPARRATRLYRAFFFPVEHIQFWDLTAPPFLDPCTMTTILSDRHRLEMAFRFTVPGLVSKYALQSSTFLTLEHTTCGGFVPRRYVLAYRPTEERAPPNCTAPPAPAFMGCTDDDKPIYTNHTGIDWCPGRASVLHVVDGFGERVGTKELWLNRWTKWSGTVTGVAVRIWDDAKNKGTVYVCGQKGMHEDEEWQVLRFDLAAVREDGNGRLTALGAQPMPWLRQQGASRCTLTFVQNPRAGASHLWVGATVPSSVDGPSAPPAGTGQARAFRVQIPPMPDGSLALEAGPGYAAPGQDAPDDEEMGVLTYGSDVQGFAFFDNKFGMPHVAVARCSFALPTPCAIEMHFLQFDCLRAGGGALCAEPKPKAVQTIALPGERSQSSAGLDGFGASFSGGRRMGTFDTFDGQGSSMSEATFDSDKVGDCSMEGAIEGGCTLTMLVKVPAGIGSLAHDSSVRAIPHQYFHASWIGATQERINVTMKKGKEPEDRVFLMRAPILQTSKPLVSRNWIAARFLGKDLFEPSQLLKFDLDGDGDADEPIEGGDDRRRRLGEARGGRRPHPATRSASAVTRGFARALASGTARPHTPGSAPPLVFSPGAGGSGGRRLAEEREGCFGAKKALLKKKLLKPFENKMAGCADGFCFCVPIWPFPFVRICGAVTGHLEMAIDLQGEVCLLDRRIGVTLVPQASVILVAQAYIDIVIARGGVQARGWMLTLVAEPELFISLTDGFEAGFLFYLTKKKCKVCVEAFVSLPKVKWCGILPCGLRWKTKTWPLGCFEFGDEKRWLLVGDDSGDGDTTPPSAPFHRSRLGAPAPAAPRLPAPRAPIVRCARPAPRTRLPRAPPLPTPPLPRSIARVAAGGEVAFRQLSYDGKVEIDCAGFLDEETDIVLLNITIGAAAGLTTYHVNAVEGNREYWSGPLDRVPTNGAPLVACAEATNSALLRTRVCSTLHVWDRRPPKVLELAVWHTGLEEWTTPTCEWNPAAIVGPPPPPGARAPLPPPLLSPPPPAPRAASDWEAGEDWPPCSDYIRQDCIDTWEPPVFPNPKLYDGWADCVGHGVDLLHNASDELRFRFSLGEIPYDARTPIGVVLVGVAHEMRSAPDDSFVDLGHGEAVQSLSGMPHDQALGVPLTAHLVGLALEHGKTYWPHVWVCDMVENCAMTVGYPILVDLTPPLAPPAVIADVSRPDFPFWVFSNAIQPAWHRPEGSDPPLTEAWMSVPDEETPPVRSRFSVFRLDDSTMRIPVAGLQDIGATGAGASSNGHVTGLKNGTIVDGERYLVQVIMTNQAGGRTTIWCEPEPRTRTPATVDSPCAPCRMPRPRPAAHAVRATGRSRSPPRSARRSATRRASTPTRTRGATASSAAARPAAGATAARLAASRGWGRRRAACASASTARRARTRRRASRASR